MELSASIKARREVPQGQGVGWMSPRWAILNPLLMILSAIRNASTFVQDAALRKDFRLRKRFFRLAVGPIGTVNDAGLTLSILGAQTVSILTTPESICERSLRLPLSSSRLFCPLRTVPTSFGWFPKIIRNTGFGFTKKAGLRCRASSAWPRKDWYSKTPSPMLRFVRSPEAP